MISIALALCCQQALLKDVHIIAMPLEKAVIQLASLYNSPMDVSTLLKDKTIIVDASQVSADEVRDQIAKTLNATWEKKESSWHLTKTVKQQQDDLARGAKMRSRFLAKMFDIRKKGLDEKPDLTNTGATQMFHQLRNEEKKAQENRNSMGPPGPSIVGYGLPNNRFLSRFLLKFGMNRIAAISNGHRAVFALHPNAMQQPLGIDISDIVAHYRSEQETWLKAALPLMKDQEGNGQGTNGRYFQSSQQMGYDLNSSFGAMPNELKDILFTVYCSDDGAYQFHLVGIPSGDSPNVIYNIKGTSYEGAFAGMEAGDFEVKPVEGFKLSQEAEDFKKFFSGGINQVPVERQAGLLAKISDPVSRDPLSFGLTESLVFDARRTKHNIIALGMDSNLNIFEPIFGDMLLQEKFKSILEEFFAIDGKWIRMFEPPYGEPNLPRYELKRLIANAKANKKVSLFDRATIASYKNRNSAVSYIEVLLDKFAGSKNESYNEQDALKLLGLLTESERSAALSNGIKFSQLNPKAQQHLFECCFFNEHSRITFSEVTNKKPMSFAITSEPTYLLPSGIPPDSLLHVDVKIKDMIKDPDEPGRGNLMTDARGWGSTKYQLEHPEDFIGTRFEFDRKRKLFRLKETTYGFKLMFNPESHWQGQLSSSDPIGNETFTIDSFPDDLKPDFEAGYKQAAESAKQRKNKGGGGSPSRQNRR